MSYTKGPWDVLPRLSDLQSELDLYVGVRDRREELKDYSLSHAEFHVAQVFGHHEREANAHLIAAAPDLYEALSNLQASPDLPQFHEQAIRALKKARGE